ncbi:bifunctional 2-polyprenyl-6-hydroxyphenol methylase/3-demethylubiquinol 3-O-methyltransferase UbiG [Alteromonas sediminis]|uniref:Ubiquinone biosynthesis O-methyltransferase n=1 Tax=Alteromonas sediminis TaxID=2259342 RepID=A0A3N5Y9F2_9ALTE|nr:bifunctional 2-polyprenyl-6-hydroxyphenol methylase/3-demethylubiquinol 3-O-methyltransferase UbiG [Alteromonas sediminis]RPJ65245.1 bifunctional 2-polyprenyl-6-hydroxyphenol methylase/3-demethylubiquinol 3-O-methyltransferase UbiG [Alteromonas sediminis]
MLDKSTLSKPLSDNKTIDPTEVAKFDKLAREWWDPQGKMRTALEFNRARLGYIKRSIESHFTLDDKTAIPLHGISILDVGSGGGLISEPLAALGADVTGIDASAVSVEVAKRHAAQSGITVDYQHTLSSELVKQKRKFDVVINAEVVEHVADQQQLINECCQLVKPQGLLILATLNKTLKSFIIAIVGAEYVMRYLPIGTHDWQYFVKPETLQSWTQAHQFSLLSQTGMKLNPFSGSWSESSDMSVNYIQSYSKV